jgi:exodeoxyribonuclease VII large subunit
VQGDQAAPQIAEMIQRVNTFGEFDLIVLCRGGGSLEDLWAFNEEITARAIAESELPVVTGIGHEIDFTIADFAADYRASTPTGAAQAIGQIYENLCGHYQYLADRLMRSAAPFLEKRKERVNELRRALLRYHPTTVIGYQRQRLDELQMSLIYSLQNAVKNAKSVVQDRRIGLTRLMKHRQESLRQRLGEYKSLLGSYDPARTLRRGYAICYKKDGSVVSAVSKISKNDDIMVKVHDGSMFASVEKVVPNEE